MARLSREIRELSPERQIQAGIDRLKARLEEIVARPQVSADDAEEAAEAALAIADLVRGRDRALRVLDAGGRDAPPAGRRETLEGLPLRDAAREVLRREGRPVHAKDLGRLIYKAGWRNPRGGADGDRIMFQLAARLGHDPDFVRWAPNTWALAEQGFVESPKNPPKPLLGIFSSPPGSLPASRIDEELAAMMDQERRAWRS